ncbi:MAG: two-component system, NarL family, sensor histidine kinase DesK, partial [Solirubrobacteraceae bacterium]|nr:two-component system, NarL family, sensor histidine kinase DesK [Solirubrobacteraceae bacterium]
AVAIVATVLFMPFHLWHLSYGLRGQRPPHSIPTLAFMAAIHVAALLIIGPAWSFMLAVLATSGLIVLRPPWSIVVLAACATGPLLAVWLEPHTGLTFSSEVRYLSYSVVFRAAIQFALVWLVAAVHQLAASRTALAAEAVAQERSRLQDEVRASLDRHLDGLDGAGRRARAALDAPGVAAPLVALDRVLALSRDALTDLRAIVADTRTPAPYEAATALARTARAGRTPIGRGLATRQAWRICLGVHAIVLLFPLLMTLNAFNVGLETHPAVAVPAWLAMAAIQLSLSLDLARGRAPRYAALRWLVVTALSIGLLPVLKGAWETSMWCIGACAAICLRGRVRIAVAAAVGPLYAAYDVLVYGDGMSTYATVWDIGYIWTVSTLAIAGLYASARLVELVSQLDQARDQLAEHAARSERHRLSRDLHDVLGQSLTAISLKGDLARRLLEHDRPAATREIDDIAGVAATLRPEIEAVARGEREVAFATEATAAVDLLRLAGVEVRTDLRVDGLDADTSTLLGWAVREGATNILRHAAARTCEIRAVRDGDVVRLELVNDGASSGDGAGTGLASLADRAAAARGSVEGSPVGGGRFRLRVEVPL